MIRNFTREHSRLVSMILWDGAPVYLVADVVHYLKRSISPGGANQPLQILHLEWSPIQQGLQTGVCTNEAFDFLQLATIQSGNCPRQNSDRLTLGITNDRGGPRSLSNNSFLETKNATQFNPGCQQSRSIAAWAMPARDNKSEASESTVVFPAPLDPEMIRSGVVACITMGLTLLLKATPSPFAITFGGARLPYERRLGGTKATIDAPFPLHAKFHIDEAHAVL